MNQADTEYQNLVHKVLTTGVRKENRTGIDTLAIFNHNYEIDLAEGFPLLTTKQVSWKNVVVENLWFLSGDSSVGFLQKHGVRFWDPWVKDGKVPNAYGHYWRNWNGIDQIRELLGNLVNSPNSRRHVVTAWDPASQVEGQLVPCHCFFVVNVLDGRLNLHLTQRSCDVALGLPYNIAGYAFLLSLLSRFTGIPVGRFGHTLIDAHVYTSKPDGSKAEYDHVPGLIRQLGCEPRQLPALEIAESIRSLEDVELLFESASTQEILDVFWMGGYNPNKPIKFKVAV